MVHPKVSPCIVIVIVMIILAPNAGASDSAGKKNDILNYLPPPVRELQLGKPLTPQHQARLGTLLNSSTENTQHYRVPRKNALVVDLSLTFRNRNLEAFEYHFPSVPGEKAEPTISDIKPYLSEGSSVPEKGKGSPVEVEIIDEKLGIRVRATRYPPHRIRSILVWVPANQAPTIK